MSKTKIAFALGIIVVVCILSAIYLLSYNPPQGKPEFEVVNLDLVEIPVPYHQEKACQLAFKLRNIGTEDATGIIGTVQVGLWNKTWGLYPEDHVLKPEETSPWLIVSLDRKPAEPTVTIIVECNEGVTQQFTESLPD